MEKPERFSAKVMNRGKRIEAAGTSSRVPSHAPAVHFFALPGGGLPCPLRHGGRDALHHRGKHRHPYHQPAEVDQQHLGRVCAEVHGNQRHVGDAPGNRADQTGQKVGVPAEKQQPADGHVDQQQRGGDHENRLTEGFQLPEIFPAGRAADKHARHHLSNVLEAGRYLSHLKSGSQHRRGNHCADEHTRRNPLSVEQQTHGGAERHS